MGSRMLAENGSSVSLKKTSSKLILTLSLVANSRNEIVPSPTDADSTPSIKSSTLNKANLASSMSTSKSSSPESTTPEIQNGFASELMPQGSSAGSIGTIVPRQAYSINAPRLVELTTASRKNPTASAAEASLGVLR